jgi:hypothetical protein
MADDPSGGCIVGCRAWRTAISWTRHSRGLASLGVYLILTFLGAIAGLGFGIALYGIVLYVRNWGSTSAGSIWWVS